MPSYLHLPEEFASCLDPSCFSGTDSEDCSLVSWLFLLLVPSNVFTASLSCTGVFGSLSFYVFSWDFIETQCGSAWVLSWIKQKGAPVICEVMSQPCICRRSTLQGGHSLCSLEVPCSVCCQAPPAISSHASHHIVRTFYCDWTTQALPCSLQGLSTHRYLILPSPQALQL
jgi:hypothetical protein